MINKSYRISKKNIPVFVKRGKRFSSELFDIKVWYDDKLPHSLFTIIISTKIDKRAVVRNTIKRKVRASIYALLEESFFRKGNYIFLIKDVKINELKSHEIKGLIHRTLR